MDIVPCPLGNKKPTMNNMMDTKLTTEQFADAIAKGLGRAMMHVKQYGIDDVADIVLDACLHSKLYDGQCESGREKWLYAMFSDSTHYNDFRTALLSALKLEHEYYDVVQICSIIEEMILDGDAIARAALRDFVLTTAALPGEKDHFGASEFIAVEGQEGLLQLASIYGARLLDNPEEDVLDCPSYENEERKAFEQLLKEHSYSDPRIKAYYDYVESRHGFETFDAISTEQRKLDSEMRKAQFLSEHTSGRIIELASDRDTQGTYMFRRFGQLAQAADLELIFAELLKSTDNFVRAKLLRVFQGTRLPAIPQCIFDWAKTDDEELKVAALCALSNSSDDRIHDFAIDQVKAGTIFGWGNSFVLDLFENNLRKDDIPLIADAIVGGSPDRHDIHHFGLTITSIAQKNSWPELKGLLVWVYENTPCSNCREFAVSSLNQIGELSKDMLNECLYDGSDEIRELAAKLISERESSAQQE